MGGVVEFVGLRAAALQPAPAIHPATRLIECIGDSIMCGAHTERGTPFPNGCGGEYRGNRESSHLSWCPSMARALGAEYQMECCSGNGLVYTDNPLSASRCDWGAVPPACGVMPKKWQQRLFCATDGVFTQEGGICDGLGGLQPLDTSTPPQAMIVDLGSNDYGSGHIPTTSLWVEAYTDFVRNISATYSPPPEIFLTVSHCVGKNASIKYCADTRAAFNSMKAAGVENVHFLDITVNGTGAWNTPPGTIGCDQHPSQTAHALMGNIAAPKVKAAMGWK
jgi:hypothetical protein